MTARDAILARLARSAAPGQMLGHVLGQTPAQIDAAAAALLIAPERPRVDAAQIEQRFVAQLSVPSIAASLDRIATLDALPAAIVAYLSAHDLPPVLCLPPDPRLAACDWSGITLHESAAPDETAVLAIARCGVAETGSLIFETSAEAPMLPNFLALHHIVVVPELVAQLEDAACGGPQPRAHYWVTGVSGTTDIEGSYVRGAHGPRFLHVIRLG